MNGRTTDVPPSMLYYTKKIKKDMKEKTNITEAQLLLNNEVKVTSPRSSWFGQTGIVRAIMADGRTLDVVLNKHGKEILIDVTLVGEIQEQTHFAKGEADLGPIANSVVQAHK